MPHAHIICGGFPAGSHAGHDIDLARLRLLTALRDAGAQSTAAADFAGLAGYLRNAALLVTYTAGPVPDDAQTDALRGWLEQGGRWVALHGSSGGKAEKPRPGEGKFRRIGRMAFHDVLGAQFLNHPPLRRFTVRHRPGGGAAAALTAGLPAEFPVVDEPYVVKLLDPDARVFLTMQCTDAEARVPPGTGGADFMYDAHPALEGPGGATLVVAYERAVGRGGVVYCALGHCHSAGRGRDGPLAGPWDGAPFQRVVANALRWGLSGAGRPARL